MNTTERKSLRYANDYLRIEFDPEVAAELEIDSVSLDVSREGVSVVAYGPWTDLENDDAR